MEVKESPVLLALRLINRKWTIEIITALLAKRQRFSDFLALHPQISSKMLSERLKELCTEGLVEKIIINMIPLRSKYQLTPKGRRLNRVLYEMALFSSLIYPEDVFHNVPSQETLVQWLKELYCVEE